MDTFFQLLTTSLKLPIPLVYSLFSFIILFLITSLILNFSKFGGYIDKKATIILYSVITFRFFTDWKTGSFDDQLASLIFVLLIYLSTLLLNILIGKFVAPSSKEFYNHKLTKILNIILILFLSALFKSILVINLNIDLLTIILLLSLVNSEEIKLVNIGKLEFLKSQFLNLIVICVSYVVASSQTFSSLLIQNNWIILLLVGLYFMINSEVIKRLYLPKLKDLE